MAVVYRPAIAADEAFLLDMLHLALFVPPGDPPLHRSVVDRPDIGRYARGFGSAPGDAGWVAADETGPLGAAWVRLIGGDDPGYGHIDDDTPELSIAVAASARGGGIGTELLGRLLEMTPRCSLSVDDRNRVVELYRRHGFRTIATDGHSLTMLRG